MRKVLYLIVFLFSMNLSAQEIEKLSAQQFLNSAKNLVSLIERKDTATLKKILYPEDDLLKSREKGYEEIVIRRYEQMQKEGDSLDFTNYRVEPIVILGKSYFYLRIYVKDKPKDSQLLVTLEVNEKNELLLNDFSFVYYLNSEKEEGPNIDWNID